MIHARLGIKRLRRDFFLDSWQAFLSDGGIFDHTEVDRVEAKLCFLWSRMIVTDEYNRVKMNEHIFAKERQDWFDDGRDWDAEQDADHADPFARGDNFVTWFPKRLKGYLAGTIVGRDEPVRDGARSIWYKVSAYGPRRAEQLAKRHLKRPETRRAVSYTHLTLPTNREV